MRNKNDVINPCIFHHWCRIQINDHEREFKNEVIDHLLQITGVEQNTTSAFLPQSNGLCERQNRAIKDSLIKVLEEKVDQWPYINDSVLFAHRVSRHTAAKYCLFFLLYKRHPVLPIDIRFDLVELQEVNGKPYDLYMFQAVPNSAYQ